MRIVLSALTALLLLVPVAEAKQLWIAGQTLFVSPPEGYCRLDPSRDDDGGLILMQERMAEGANHILENFALCTELEDWHAHRINNLRHFGNVMASLENGSAYTLNLSRQGYLDEMAKQVPAVDYEDATSVINQRIEAAQMSDTRFLGVLHQDEHAIYAGLLIAIETEGQKLPQAEILAVTLLGKVPVSINIQGPADEEGVLDKLLALQEAYAAELVQLNP